jgi:lipopolysaccharide transport system ATP-binding protein
MERFDASRPAVLTVRHIAVYFKQSNGLLDRRRITALKNVSFDLYRGESLGIIGHNGSGKSTLLKCLSGIILPDQGTIVNHGYSAALLSLRLGFDGYLSGRDNIILSGILLGFRKWQVEQHMADIIEFSELGEFIDLPLNTYSDGMKARLGFSVAFYMEPDILLIDEVLGVGDADFQRKSQEVMEKKIASDSTIVLVSHSAPAIRRLCNRAVWIENGETQLEGEVGRVVDAYEAFLAQLRDDPKARTMHI